MAVLFRLCGVVDPVYVDPPSKDLWDEMHMHVMTGGIS